MSFDYSVLFDVLLYVAVFVVACCLPFVAKSGKKAGGPGGGGPCARPTGVWVRGVDGENGVDCDAECGSAVGDTFRPVLVEGEDVFVDGERAPRPGIYCVRSSAAVTRCNTSTSQLVRGAGGDWHCRPNWPELFGGADGGDILACGGKLSDGPHSYEYRLPPSSRLAPIDDPYAAVARLRCTPGEYTDGPRDHMNNNYLPLEGDRFRRTRNWCAAYVANAVGIVGPVIGRAGLCNCLSSHGRLRRAPARALTGASADRERRDARDEPSDGGGAEASPAVYRVSHACSPCTASGGLITTGGVFNFPVGCVKSNQKYFGDSGTIDLLPCGTRGFASASEPSCVNAWVFVGDQGASFAAKRAIERLVIG